RLRPSARGQERGAQRVTDRVVPIGRLVVPLGVFQGYRLPPQRKGSLGLLPRRRDLSLERLGRDLQERRGGVLKLHGVGRGLGQDDIELGLFPGRFVGAAALG